MSGLVAVVDTSILVGAKNPAERAQADCARRLEIVREGGIRPLLSTVTVSEGWAGFNLEKDPTGRQPFLDHVRSVGVFEVRPVDVEIADAAARIRAQTSLRLPDALALATGVPGSAELIVTHDREIRRARAILPSVSARKLVRRVEADRGASRSRV